jgi:hypothetical protein
VSAPAIRLAPCLLQGWRHQARPSYSPPGLQRPALPGRQQMPLPPPAQNREAVWHTESQAQVKGRIAPSKQSLQQCHKQSWRDRSFLRSAARVCIPTVSDTARRPRANAAAAMRKEGCTKRLHRLMHSSAHAGSTCAISAAERGLCDPSAAALPSPIAAIPLLDCAWCMPAAGGGGRGRGGGSLARSLPIK